MKLKIFVLSLAILSALIINLNAKSVKRNANFIKIKCSNMTQYINIEKIENIIFYGKKYLYIKTSGNLNESIRCKFPDKESLKLLLNKIKIINK